MFSLCQKPGETGSPAKSRLIRALTECDFPGVPYPVFDYATKGGTIQPFNGDYEVYRAEMEKLSKAEVDKKPDGKNRKNRKNEEKEEARKLVISMLSF